MKKKLIKISLFVFFSLFVFAGGVVAATLTAKDIAFTSTNENLNATNVEEAINELYVIGNDKIPASYEEGYNDGVKNGKPTKKQTVSKSISVSGQTTTTVKFTFSELTEITGITNLITGDALTVNGGITISGNTVTVSCYNRSSGTQTPTMKCTAIGYWLLNLKK